MVLIFHRGRGAPDQIKEAVASRWNMSTVLNVVGRPELLGGRKDLPFEQRVESLKDQRLVLLLDCLFHVCLRFLENFRYRCLAPIFLRSAMASSGLPLVPVETANNVSFRKAGHILTCVADSRAV